MLLQEFSTLTKSEVKFLYNLMCKSPYGKDLESRNEFRLNLNKSLVREETIDILLNAYPENNGLMKKTFTAGDAYNILKASESFGMDTFAMEKWISYNLKWDSMERRLARAYSPELVNRLTEKMFLVKKSMAERNAVENIGQQLYIVRKRSENSFSKPMALRVCKGMLNPNYEFLTGSSDGYLVIDGKVDRLVEIKSPLGLRPPKPGQRDTRQMAGFNDIFEAWVWYNPAAYGRLGLFLGPENQIYLDSSSSTFCQIQMQMCIANVRYTDLVINSTEDVRIIQVERDEGFINETLYKLSKLFPILRKLQ